MNGRLLRVLLALMFLAGFSILLSSGGSAASYTANDTLHNLTFSNLTAMQQSSSTVQNLTYQINITNYGNFTEGEQYNLSVMNCSNLSQAGVGVLSSYFLNLSQNQSQVVYLYVSNSTAGVYSSCIKANHWNGSETETSWNLSSSSDGIILNSSFYPDLSTSSVHWASAQGNVTVHNATLTNSGDFNFSGNITVRLMWDGTLKESKTVENSSLTNGTSSNVSFSNITSATNGLHNLTVWLDVFNNVTESNEANNNYTVSVPILGYNVTVLSITGQSVLNVTTSRNVSISVSVKYENGDNVTNLSRDNFTVYDIWNGTTLDTWNSQDTLLNVSFNSSLNASGIYSFIITSCTPINDSVLGTTPGIHNITVNVSNSESNNTYSGNSSGNNYYYFIVPKLVVTLTASSHFVNERSTRSITINISNTGTDTIYNVSITTAAGTGLSVPSTPGGCSKTLGNNVLSTGSDYIICSVTAEASDVSDDTASNVDVMASGVHNYSGSPLIQYTETESWALTVQNIDEGDGGGGGGVTTCTYDSQCTETKACVNNACTEISCPNGEIADHMCFTYSYKINITSYPSILQAVSGGSNSTKVTVKNSGTNTFTAKLEVAISGITASVSPASYNLSGGESYQFTVNFTVPNTTTIGSFSGSFKAYVSTATSTYDTKAFTFKVLPVEETKTDINASYQELLLQFQNLTSQLNQLKSSGYNQSVLSTLENLISSTNSTLEQMKNAMDSDDYVTAQSLISQINSSLSSAESEVGNVLAQKIQGITQEYGMWFWAAIIVIIVFVVGFFLYMFYPAKQEGYHPEKGFVQPETGKVGLGEKIKRVFRRKKKEQQPEASITNVSSFAKTMAEKDEEPYETFHYSEGYKKEKSYTYDYKKPGKMNGFFQKLKRRREKKSPQMHIDQFNQPIVAEQKTDSE